MKTESPPTVCAWCGCLVASRTSPAAFAVCAQCSPAVAVTQGGAVASRKFPVSRGEWTVELN